MNKKEEKSKKKKRETLGFLQPIEQKTAERERDIPAGT